MSDEFLEEATKRISPQAVRTAGLFVSESDDWVVAGSTERGVDGPGRGSHECERDRGKNPGRGNQNRQAWVGLLQNRLRQKGKRYSQTGSQQRKDKGFTQQHAHDVEPGETQRFENPDLARTLHHHGVHIQKDH